MSAVVPPRPVIRGIAVLGGLLALAAVGLAADRRGGPVTPPLPVISASTIALAAPPPIVLASAHSSASPSGSASAPAASSAVPPAGILPDGRVVLNIASEEDLKKLPGIGPSRAKAILALRERRGKFRSTSELLRVKGIGRKTLARLTPRMVLDPPP